MQRAFGPGPGPPSHASFRSISSFFAPVVLLMLALTDETLARIAIAACAVPADQRGRWLRRFAKRLERQTGELNSPLRSREKQRAGAARTRLCRKRQKAGYSVLNVLVNFNSASEALFAAGLLQEYEIDDPAAVSRALEKIIALLPERLNTAEV